MSPSPAKFARFDDARFAAARMSAIAAAALCLCGWGFGTLPAVHGQAQFIELPAEFVQAHFSAPVAGNVLYGQVNVAGTLRAARWSPSEGVTILNPAGVATDIVTGVSADGNVAVGTIGAGNSRLAFRYVHAPGGGDVALLNYTGTEGATVYSSATVCSLDGSVVYGVIALSSQNQRVFRWTNEGMALPTSLSSSNFNYEAIQCSDDGGFLVGTHHNTGASGAYLYSLSGGSIPLGGGGGMYNPIACISSAGDTAAIFSFGGSYVWKSGGTTEQIPGIVQGGSWTEPKFMSLDGSVVAGHSAFASNKYRAYWWSSTSGTRDLGAFAGGDQSYVTGISGRAKIIVGNARDGSGSEAFITRRNSNVLDRLRNMAIDALPGDPNLQFWRFEEPTCISRDGLHYFIEGERSGVERVAYLNFAPYGGDVNSAPAIETTVGEGETVRVELGQTVTLSFKATDQDGDAMFVRGSGLRSAFTLTPGSGGSVPTSGIATLRIRPVSIDVGTHDVSVTFDDKIGGVTTRSFRIEVPANQNPSLSPIAAQSFECKGEQNLVTLQTTIGDAESSQSYTVKWKVNGQQRHSQSGLARGAAAQFTYDYPHGLTTVQVEATDDFGGTTTTETSITVLDTTPPGIVLAQTATLSTDKGKDFASATRLPRPTIKDDAHSHLVVSNDAPAKLGLGEHLVKWTVVDSAGNVASASQRVTVADQEAPVVKTGSAYRTFVDPGQTYATIELRPPTASDNVDGSVKVSGNRPAKRFPCGTTVVTWTARDAAGNQGVWKQSVIVENRKPVANVKRKIQVTTTSSGGKRVQLDASASSDKDRQKLSFQWSAKKAGKAIRFQKPRSAKTSAQFPIGTTNVKLVVTDPVGAKSTVTVQVKVVLKNGKKRGRGGAANDSFAQASRSATDGVASGGGAAAYQAQACAIAAENIGARSGDCILWNEGESPAAATLEYASLRQLQLLYGRQAADAALASFLETGDLSAYDAYEAATNGVAHAAIDLSEE